MMHEPATAVSVPRGCPQCEAHGARPLPQYSQAPWRIVECRDCGFVYLKDAPDYSRLVREFAFEKTREDETQRRKARSPVLFWLEHATRWRLALSTRNKFDRYRRWFAPGRVLDVGCGGHVTIPEPYIPFGIEVSEELARMANVEMARRGGRVVNAPAIEGIAEFPSGYFSGVVLQSFLEHELRPKALLWQVARVLADGGAAYVRVPNYGSLNRRVMGARWCGFRHPDHVNYFTVSSLRRMARDCGLRLKLIELLSLPCGDNIKAVLSKA
jgi:SAM-dependent methyltransferase